METNGTATFTVTARGSQPLAYQWLRNGINLPGANAATLRIANVSAADAVDYRVVITNQYGAVTSSIASLFIVAPPTIIAQPQGRNAFVSQTVSFNVGVIGSPPLRYQWRYNSVNIPGERTHQISRGAIRLPAIDHANGDVREQISANSTEHRNQQ